MAGLTGAPRATAYSASKAGRDDGDHPPVPGNFRSSWAAAGGYDYVAEALFSELNVDGFFLEYDDERSGGFEPPRFVPPGKLVVLGLVTTKRGDLEDPGDLKRRIDEDANRCRRKSGGQPEALPVA